MAGVLGRCQVQSHEIPWVLAIVAAVVAAVMGHGGVGEGREARACVSRATGFQHFNISGRRQP
jgi:hypothetical protein